MSRFEMVTDDRGDRYAINVDSILWLSPETCNVCMLGTSGVWSGLITLSPESIQRLLDIMTVVDGHGER